MSMVIVCIGYSTMVYDPNDKIIVLALIAGTDALDMTDVKKYEMYIR